MADTGATFRGISALCLWRGILPPRPPACLSLLLLGLIPVPCTLPRLPRSSSHRVCAECVHSAPPGPAGPVPALCAQPPPRHVHLGISWHPSLLVPKTDPSPTLCPSGLLLCFLQHGGQCDLGCSTRKRGSPGPPALPHRPPRAASGSHHILFSPHMPCLLPTLLPVWVLLCSLHPM